MKLPDVAFTIPSIFRRVYDTKTYKSIMIDEQGRIFACGIEWDIIGKNLGVGIWEVTLKERIHGR